MLMFSIFLDFNIKVGYNRVKGQNTMYYMLF